jgi:AraC-like DNA-binding protein
MKLTNWTKTQIDDLINDYEQGLHMSKIESKYGYSSSYLRRILSFLKIKRIVNKRIYTKKDISLKYPKILKHKEEILRLYKDNKMTISILSKRFNIPRRQFNYFFKDTGINVRKMNRTYSLDNNYFSIIDSADKSYFLGLIYADGWVREKTGYMGIALVEKTPILLETFNKYLKSSRPIKKYKCKSCSLGYYYRLDVNSYKVLDDLKLLGVTQNKTHTLVFPKLPQHLQVQALPLFLCILVKPIMVTWGC